MKMSAKGYDMKNPVSECKYAMKLLIDEDAENLVWAYINALRSKGLRNANFIHAQYQQHISLPDTFLTTNHRHRKQQELVSLH